MPDILLEVTVQATTNRVYRALTEGEEVTAWWTPWASAEPKVGSTLQVRFSKDDFVHKFEVVELVPAAKVEWLTRDSLPEWNGTRITWDLTEADHGTKILFGHRGWASADGILPFCSYHWAGYLTSLKDYLEKGKGNPFSG